MIQAAVSQCQERRRKSNRRNQDIPAKDGALGEGVRIFHVSTVVTEMSETCQNASMIRILVIEDNRDLVGTLFDYFEARDYSMDSAPDGKTGLTLAQSNHYDVIVLDWNLPRLSGLEVLEQLRAAGKATPIIMLTSRGEVEDKVSGFRGGANDYLTKPFALQELEVRIEALVKPVANRVNTVLRVGDLEYDRASMQVRRGDQVLHVYPACRRLLEVLMQASPSAVTREDLEFAVWGDEPPDADRLRSHIYDLRKVIDGPFNDKLLQTLPRIGYRLAPVTDEASGK